MVYCNQFLYSTKHMKWLPKIYFFPCFRYLKLEKIAQKSCKMSRILKNCCADQTSRINEKQKVSEKNIA